MRPTLLILAAVAVLKCSALGMFMWHETEQVPITRLFTNLQQRLATNANDYQLHYQLARLHAMAFATNVAQMPVTKQAGDVVFGFPGSDTGIPRVLKLQTNALARTSGWSHLTNALAHYDRALALMKKSTNADEVRWLILPTQLGQAWCLQQAGRPEDALSAYRRTLKIAWQMEVTGQFKFDEWIKDVWDDIKSLKNPLHSRSQGYIGPGVCFSEETIGYLLKLLDPVKDASEIADLAERQKRLQSMGRAITPILVPLEDAPFEALVDPHARVAFDLDGSGLQRHWGWLTPKAAWLVYDSRSGRISSALQMFGSVTFWIFWRGGYQALGALDADGDGSLRGDELLGLALWHDRNGNGISDPGEVRPLSAYGIRVLDCHADSVAPTLLRSARGVQFEDGSSRPTYDWAVPQTGQ